MDAAIAVSFALAVVNPAAGNIGGGGFMVTRLADGTTSALDYREKAPAGCHPDMYLDAAGELTDASVLGHLASGVPGTVMGMWEAHPVRDPSLADARGARGGARRRLRGARALRPVDPRVEERALELRHHARDLPARGEPPEVGSRFSQPELAATLRRIMEGGPDGFYRGETAELIVAEMERGAASSPTRTSRPTQPCGGTR
jgi:gamma-glutamyltranspeptidase / glutathione hydrolase